MTIKNNKDKELQKIKCDLDFAKHNLNVLIALMNFDNINIVKANINRAVCCLNAIEDSTSEITEFFIKLGNE